MLTRLYHAFTGGWRCWILTGPGRVGAASGLAVRLAQVLVLVTLGLTHLTYGPCLLCPYYTLLVTIPTIMLGYFWFSAFLIPPG